jgi:hypothetical protein
MLRFFTFWAVRKIEEIGAPEPNTNYVHVGVQFAKKMRCFRVRSNTILVDPFFGSAGVTAPSCNYSSD